MNKKSEFKGALYPTRVPADLDNVLWRLNGVFHAIRGLYEGGCQMTEDDVVSLQMMIKDTSADVHEIMKWQGEKAEMLKVS